MAGEMTLGDDDMPFVPTTNVDAIIARLLDERRRLKESIAKNSIMLASFGEDATKHDESDPYFVRSALQRPARKRGRHPDTTATDITRAILDYAQENRKPPTKAQVAAVIGRSEDAIDDCLRKEVSARWQDWCDAAVKWVGVQPRNRSH